MNMEHRDVTFRPLLVNAACSLGVQPQERLDGRRGLRAALISTIGPSKVSEMMTASASKYTETRPMI